jgi:flagellar hook-basal body complex protein FliE
MSMDAITAIGGLGGIVEPTGVKQPGAAGGAGFENWLAQQLVVTNEKLVEADQGVRRLALGEAENLHQVMIALEEAKLRFDLVVQVRNRLVEAYQDVLRMRI